MKTKTKINLYKPGLQRRWLPPFVVGGSGHTNPSIVGKISHSYPSIVDMASHNRQVGEVASPCNKTWGWPHHHPLSQKSQKMRVVVVTCLSLGRATTPLIIDGISTYPLCSSYKRKVVVWLLFPSYRGGHSKIAAPFLHFFKHEIQ